MNSTVTVSERALLERARREARRAGMTLRVCRTTSPSFHNLGRFYLVDSERNHLVQADVDLASFVSEPAEPAASQKVSA